MCIIELEEISESLFCFEDVADYYLTKYTFGKTIEVDVTSKTRENLRTGEQEDYYIINDIPYEEYKKKKKDDSIGVFRCTEEETWNDLVHYWKKGFVKIFEEDQFGNVKGSYVHKNRAVKKKGEFYEFRKIKKHYPVYVPDWQPEYDTLIGLQLVENEKTESHDPFESSS